MFVASMVIRCTVVLGLVNLTDVNCLQVIRGVSEKLLLPNVVTGSTGWQQTLTRSWCILCCALLHPVISLLVRRLNVWVSSCSLGPRSSPLMPMLCPPLSLLMSLLLRLGNRRACPSVYTRR